MEKNRNNINDKDINDNKNISSQNFKNNVQQYNNNENDSVEQKKEKKS